MPVGYNPNLVGITGTILQKNAFAAYTKQLTKMSANTRTRKAGGHRSGGGTDEAERDTAVISREGIAALETARSIGEDTVVRNEEDVSGGEPAILP